MLSLLRLAKFFATNHLGVVQPASIAETREEKLDLKREKVASYVCSPSGPRRHSGVSVAWHILHLRLRLFCDLALFVVFDSSEEVNTSSVGPAPRAAGGTVMVWRTCIE